jgi:glycosyltransferase involved in cell wall biosynthesis
VNFKEKVKSLTVLRRQYLEEIIAFLTTMPYLMAIFNLFIIAMVRAKRLARKVLGRSPGIPEPAMSPIVPLQKPRWVPARLHVLLIVEASIPHCFRYRVQQKIEHLELAGYTVSWVSWPDFVRARQEIHFSHVVIFYRVPAFDDVVGIIELARALNKVVFYDVDDLIFDREIMEKKVKSFCKGLSEKECSDLLTGAELYKRAIRMCAYTIGSTSALCEQLAHLGNKSYLHRNALDSNILDYVTKRFSKIKRDHITIFYGSGTNTHDNDFEVAAPSLVRILETFPNVCLIIVGFLKLPKEFDAYTDRIDRLAFLSSESYWECLGSADINIAPLQPGIFCDCKSEIKWLEAAILKVPSVVSDTRTYREVVRDGGNAYIASSSQEWYEKIASLVKDSTLRQLMGKNAYASACAGYKPQSSAQNLKKIIKDVMSLETDRCVVRPVSRKKRIVYVNVLYPPQDLGGATVVVKNHIDTLLVTHGSEFEVAVFTSSNTSSTAYAITEYEHEGIHVTSISAPPGIDLDWRYQDAHVDELFRRYIELQQPDLIHFHCVQRLTASMLKVAWQCKIPYFVTLHDSWWLCDRQFMINSHGRDCEQVCVDPLICSGCVEDIDGSIARRSYLTEQLKNASLLLAVSSYQQQLYKHNGFDNVVLNCNGILKTSEMKRKRHDGKLQVGYLGGVCVHKGYYFLEEVVKNIDLKQSEIIVVDFGLQSGKVRRKTWGSTPVRFIPKLPFADMPAFYSKLDVVIVPSLGRESFGLGVREAIVNSVWVVAPEAGGLAEDIREGIDGHIFSKGSKEELTAILKEIDSNPSFYQEKRNIDTSHIRSIEEQVEELVSYYKRT